MMYIVIFDGTTADVVPECELEEYLIDSGLGKEDIEGRFEDEDEAYDKAEEVTFNAQLIHYENTRKQSTAI